jgi:hypothetical protein
LNIPEPNGRKSRIWKKEFAEFKCPTMEWPFIATKFNS